MVKDLWMQVVNLPEKIINQFLMHTGQQLSIYHYLIIRSTSDTLIATPLNGTIYDISSAYDALGDTVVAYQSNTSFTNNGLNPATKYYYYIFAANYNLCTNGPVYLAIDPLKDSVITNCAM